MKRVLWRAQITENGDLRVQEFPIVQCDDNVPYPWVRLRTLEVRWVRCPNGKPEYPYGWTRDSALGALREHIQCEIRDLEDRKANFLRNLEIGQAHLLKQLAILNEGSCLPNPE